MSCTARETADTAKAAADTATNTLVEMQAEQRPWIVVTAERIAELEIGTQIRGVIAITNSGKTVALQVNGSGALFVTNDPSADMPPMPKGKTTELILAPGQTLDIAVSSGNRFGSKDIRDERELAALKQPDTKYYAYGTMTYTDTSVTRSVHHTQFCYWVTIGSTNLQPCVGKSYVNKAD